MPGKYRPVRTAEKRAQLEAAGEEWPIGSDGLPMKWDARRDIVSGGRWRLRSAARDAVNRWAATPKGQAACAKRDAKNTQRNTKRLWIRSHYIGMEHHFPAPREVVETTLRRSFDELRAKQAAEKEAFNESVA